MHPSRFRIASLCLCLFALALPVLASHPTPVFGPLTFERTEGDTNAYTVSFETPAAGEYVLHVRNGDAEGGRVASATIEVNGSIVVSSSDLNETVAGLRRVVDLPEGTGELAVTVAGAPGSFLTVAILDRSVPAVFVHGRLILPWGRDDDDRALGLAFKNGSAWAPRAVRVVFFHPDGRVAGASRRFVLPPRGSVASAVADLIDEDAWQVGSIEVYFAGPGPARLFGTARQWTPALGDSDVQPLLPAGIHVSGLPAGRAAGGNGRGVRD